MPNYKMVDADVLDGAMLATAEAIRTKTESEDPVTWNQQKGFESAILAIQSGVELNFVVVGGTTKPTNTTKNTVWVNTSETITGWVFSSTEPTGSTGLVWIQTGTSASGAFNALTENNIMVYPTKLYQYSGGWKEKAGGICVNGTWTDISAKEYYFHENGSDVAFNKASETNASVSVGTSSIVITRNTSEDSGHGSYCVTKNKYSFAGKTKLVFNATVTENFDDAAGGKTNTWRGRFVILSNTMTKIAAPSDQGLTEYQNNTPPATKTNRKNYELPVTSLQSGTYAFGWWGCGTVTIHNIYAE